MSHSWRVLTCWGDDTPHYRVDLCEVPLWAKALSEGVDAACARCGHVLCGSSEHLVLRLVPLGWVLGWALRLADTRERVLHSCNVPEDVALAVGAVVPEDSEGDN